MSVQLILERHKFELHRSIYTLIFFSVGNTTLLHDLQLVASGDAELHYM